MVSNTDVFRIFELFDDYQKIEERLKLYTESTKFKFSTGNSKTLAGIKNLPENYNSKLIYDEKYFKCNVNPKPSTLNNFLKKNPGVKVDRCPALIVFRTTPSKQHLKITQLKLEHDHDPSAPPRLEEYKKQVAEGKNIQENDIVNTESPTITTTAATTSSTTSTTTTTEFTSSVTDSSNEQVKSSTYQDSSNGEASSDQSHIIDVPTVINEDFDYILSKLDINFSSSRNKEELENKITRIKKLVQLYDSNSDELKIQSEDNCTSASLSTIGSLSIHLSRARGRAKGKKNRFLGQPTNELNDNPNSFELLSEPQKKIFTLKLILSDEDKVLRIIKYKIKISIENLKHLSLKSIPDALASDSIEIKIIKEYFERDAFVYLDELIISKKRSDYWTCKICKMELSTSDSVECDKCLFWSHFSCVGLVQEPESYWSCPKGC